MFAQVGISNFKSALRKGSRRKCTFSNITFNPLHQATALNHPYSFAAQKRSLIELLLIASTKDNAGTA